MHVLCLFSLCACIRCSTFSHSLSSVFRFGLRCCVYFARLCDTQILSQAPLQCSFFYFRTKNSLAHSYTPIFTSSNTSTNKMKEKAHHTRHRRKLDTGKHSAFSHIHLLLVYFPLACWISYIYVTASQIAHRPIVVLCVCYIRPRWFHLNASLWTTNDAQCALIYFYILIYTISGNNNNNNESTRKTAST